MALLINDKINIQDNQLTNGLIPIFQILDKIESSTEREIIFDCSSLLFVTPVFVISLFLYSKSCSKKCIFQNLPPYFRTIMFDSTVMPDRMNNDAFMAFLSSYSSKTFIPIVNFPAKIGSEDIKDKIISAVETILYRQVDIPTNIICGLKYMLGEMVGNITEHSDSERGYIFAQAYPSKHFLDICIADEGITLKESYSKGGIIVEDDLEAMSAVRECISSKNIGRNDNRGYGIKTTKNMLSIGLDGQFIIMSGGAIAIKSQKVDTIISLPNGIRWNGTVIAMRIPYQQKESFNYCNFLE